MSAALTQIHPNALDELKNAYSLEFLSLPDGHSERDLHRALVRNLGRFITELGRDFCFVGDEYPVQVGNQDFAIDLVFFHRGLACLVAFELKVGKFEPEHLGKLAFYVEALDRDVKKPHERPSIGVLLCASKDTSGRADAYERRAPMTIACLATTVGALLHRAQPHRARSARLGDPHHEPRQGHAAPARARSCGPSFGPRAARAAAPAVRSSLRSKPGPRRGATAEQLAAWAKRLLTARTLDEVFAR